MKRVVVTGIGMLSPFGSGVGTLLDAVFSGASAVRAFPEWEEYRGLRTRLGASIPSDALPPDSLPPKLARSMGRVAKLAVHAAELALADAGIARDAAMLKEGGCGVAFGSGIGSVAALMDYTRFLTEKSTQGLQATTYHRMMSHTCASNVGIAFGITGRLIPTSSACTSGSQAVGYAYETIRSGAQTLMIAGGAEEFGPAVAAIFDVLGACSVARGESSPRPFDTRRDGIVIGEGSAALVLEELEHARARGARILAELSGFGTNSDGWHITNPKVETMARCIGLALEDARIPPDAIGYVNAHATGTPQGDLAECLAMTSVFTRKVPTSSIKGHIGHTLGACGAIEAAATIAMLGRGMFAPTRNLSDPMPEASSLDLVRAAPMERSAEYAMSNTFAFGGINTSLVFRHANLL